MSHRPLVFVSGLTLGDYLLWNWSLNHNHDVLALVSGLTLPPLAVAGLWLLTLSAMRLLGSYTRRSGVAAARAAARGPAPSSAQTSASAVSSEEPSAPSGSSSRSSGKLAA